MRVKGLHVSKRFKEIKFDGISGKLDSKFASIHNDSQNI